MSRRPSTPRRSVPAVPAAAALGAVLLAGCGAPEGLGPGEPAPSASAQPRPQTLWPAWSPESSSPSDAVTDPELQPAPDPLPDSPAVPAGGLAAMDQTDVLRADPRMRRLTRRGPVDKPGKPGIRPAVLHDLTGDGKPELICAVDLESGRVVMAAYTVRDGKIVPILYTSGVRPVVESVGVDLVVRGSATDGGEQAIRYRWDGNRMLTVSEVRSFRADGDAPESVPGKEPTPKDVAPPKTKDPEPAP
ncbi:lipoprotein [Streptomyces spiroverticillatus]|uniref:Lipoprotein n=1 Tax=Streptomyces finlayi TaxID=67296 RepID=A0A919CER7_9ACTN|nr:hypothetical protein [Streptomyces finlayi]GHA40082.1 lipoprotein [Streptomyces spiroverticillatus]GHD15711.1 lipoprotein [Streptomyces finlayi]